MLLPPYTKWQESHDRGQTSASVQAVPVLRLLATSSASHGSLPPSFQALQVLRCYFSAFLDEGSCSITGLAPKLLRATRAI